MEILFFKSIRLNHPGGLKNIILKYSSLKRRQLRKIDLTLAWKNGRSEHIFQIGTWKAGDILFYVVNHG